MTRLTLEVCVDTLEGAIAAADNGANRIELCASLSEGGLTPSSGFMQAAAKLPVPVYAMIRPRGGTFVCSEAEKDLMIADIKAAEAIGLAGIVIGATTPDGRLDGAFLKAALASTRLKATLHRAFDTLSDPRSGLEEAIGLGFERILTSGQALTAVEGADVIAALTRSASGRIAIMAGAGVTAANIDMLVGKTGVREVHASCSAARPPLDRASPETRLGFVPADGSRTTDPAMVAALAKHLTTLERPIP